MTLLTYVADFGHTLVNDLDDLLQPRSVEETDAVAELLLLLERQYVVVGDRSLRSLPVTVAWRRLLAVGFRRCLGGRRNRRGLFALLLVLGDLLLLRLLEPGESLISSICASMSRIMPDE